MERREWEGEESEEGDNGKGKGQMRTGKKRGAVGKRRKLCGSRQGERASECEEIHLSIMGCKRKVEGGYWVWSGVNRGIWPHLPCVDGLLVAYGNMLCCHTFINLTEAKLGLARWTRGGLWD